MACEIAAVDRGNIAGLQRPQILRVVPVVKVPPEALHPAHGLQHRFESRRHVGRSRPAEVARAHGRKQVQADIRGRRAVSDHLPGGLLKVVRRKHAVPGRDESLEIAPGASRHQAQRARVRIGDRRMSRHRPRAARPVRDGRRRHPCGSERERDQPGPPGVPGGQRRGSAYRDAAPHESVVRGKLDARALCRLGRGHPFQQVPAGCETPESSRDRVEHEPGLMRQESNQQRHLARRQSDLPAERPGVAQHAEVAASRQDGRERRKHGRNRKHRQQKCGPDQRRR